MRKKGFARGDGPPLVIKSEFGYSRKKDVYIFHEFDPEVDFFEVFREDVVLFPHVSPSTFGRNVFRRCDGVWLKFEDPVTSLLVWNVCRTVETGGYPPLAGYAVEMLAWEFRREFGEESKVRAGFAVAQACASGALGEFSLDVFGYEVPEEVGRVPEEVPEPEDRVSLYAGKLALWEVGEGKFPEREEAMHTLCSLYFRRLRARSEECGEFDGRSVANAVEYLCRKMGAKGFPHPGRGDAGYVVALMIESGALELGELDPWPHT